MNVSANSLFYFTDEIRWIIDMLDKGYMTPRYCEERFDKEVIATGTISLPMKCFCDLPLSMILPHLKEYGCYGVGFSKKWGISIGASPLTYYADKSSPIVQEFIAIVNEKLYKLNAEKESEQISKSEYNKQVVEAISIIPRFLKPYKGAFNKGVTLEQEKCYYDEKEWRYVPKISTYIDEQTAVFALEQKDYKALNEVVKKKIHIPFSLCDIRYIIVKENHEVMKICDFLTQKYGNSILRDISYKIITMEQIENDF